MTGRWRCWLCPEKGEANDGDQALAAWSAHYLRLHLKPAPSSGNVAATRRKRRRT